MNRSSLLSRPRRRMAALLVLLLLLTLVPAAMAQPEAPEAAPTDGLNPGEHVTYTQRVPINVVFVGYEQGDLSLGDMTGVLPASYSPIVRYPPFYGLEGRDMGLRFNFRYDVKWAGQRFEDDFFDYLGSIATPGPMTLFQAQYNDQPGVLDVADTVWYIDAPSTEAWLMGNAGRLGVDTSRGYTIFFVNWYSRPDFQFHVYTKTDFADPDTDYNFGEIRATRKMIAWGGSHGRGWFYDLSAGPEAWTDNWNVTDEDVDGDGLADYRMPPVWEYDAAGHRDPAQLGQDLGYVARFVAINLLFTSSPLYDPLASSPGPDGGKIAHVEMMELDGVRAVNGVDFLDIDFTRDALAAFQPYYEWDAAVEENKPPDIAAVRALRIAGGRALIGGCWEDYGTPFAQLFCNFNERYDRYFPAYGDQDYVVPVVAYHATPHRMGALNGLLGFADDNWVDGTPSFVFEFDNASLRSIGYGFSTTTVHEVGHHIGLSHPHDGYDSELGIDYGPGGDLYFAWSGDESDTIMSYIDVGSGFGQFDQDNMNRYIFAGYLNWANQVLADIVAHPDAQTVRMYVNAAEAHAVTAQRAFNRWDYATAALNARQAYEQIATAAMQLGVSTSVELPLRATAPTGTPPKQGEPPRFPDN